MNKSITSKEAILSVSKEMVMQQGLQSLNIRDIAKKCGVCVGSVYNYFPSKSDLVVATTQSIWTEIMHGSQECHPQASFVEAVINLFNSVQKSNKKYNSFFTVHSVNVSAVDKSKGKQAMNMYFEHIKAALLAALNQDKNVKSSSFTADFSKEEFVGFVFSNIISLTLKNETSCNFLLEIVKRTIY